MRRAAYCTAWPSQIKRLEAMQILPGQNQTLPRSCAIIDTGAARSVITRRRLERLQKCLKLRGIEVEIEENPEALQFLTATGSVTSSYEVAHLPVKELGIVKFHIVESSNGDRIPPLIGVDYLRSIKANIKLPKGQMSVEINKKRKNVKLNKESAVPTVSIFAEHSTAHVEDALALYVSVVKPEESVRTVSDSDGKIKTEVTADMKKMLGKLHKALGHSPKIKDVLRSYGYPDTVLHAYQAIIQDCPGCNAYVPNRRYPKAGTAQFGTESGKVALMDIFYLSPEENSRRVLHILDGSDGYTFVKPLPERSLEGELDEWVTEAFIEYIADSKICPETLLVDMGSENTGDTFASFTELYGIDLQTSAFKDSRHHSKVERSHAEVRKMHVKVRADLDAANVKPSLETLLRLVAHTLNEIPYLRTKFSPNIIRFGISPVDWIQTGRFRDDSLVLNENDDKRPEPIRKKLAMQRAAQKAATEQNAKGVLQRAMSHRITKVANYNPGDIVEVRSFEKNDKTWSLRARVIRQEGSHSVMVVINDRLRKFHPNDLRLVTAVTEPAHMPRRSSLRRTGTSHAIEVAPSAETAAQPAETETAEAQPASQAGPQAETVEQPQQAAAAQPAKQECPKCKNEKSTKPHSWKPKACKKITCGKCLDPASTTEVHLQNKSCASWKARAGERKVIRAQLAAVVLEDDLQMYEDAVKEAYEDLPTEAPEGFAGRENAGSYEKLMKLCDGRSGFSVQAKSSPQKRKLWSESMDALQNESTSSLGKVSKIVAHTNEGKVVVSVLNAAGFDVHCVRWRPDGTSQVVFKGDKIKKEDIVVQFCVKKQKPHKIQLPIPATDRAKGQIEITWTWATKYKLSVDFKESTIKELQEIQEKEVYDVVEEQHIEEGANYCSSRMVLTVKFDRKGLYKRPKSRFVARGFDDERPVRTDAPTCRADSLASLLVYSRTKNYKIASYDVEGAFLCSKPFKKQDVVYLSSPMGFSSEDKLKMVGMDKATKIKLKKCLYGLRDAPRSWFRTYRTSLLELGFTQSRADGAMFILAVDPKTKKIINVEDKLNPNLRESDFVGPENLRKPKNEEYEVAGVICVHVDDTIVTGSDWFFDTVWDALKSRHVMGEEDIISNETGATYVGRHLKVDKGDVVVNMRDYSSKINCLQGLEEFDGAADLNEAQQKEWQKRTGKLNWCQTSRCFPDLCFSTRKLQKRNQQARVQDVKGLNKLIKSYNYADGNLWRFPKMRGPLKIVAQVDASHNNKTKEKSTVGYVIWLCEANPESIDESGIPAYRATMLDYKSMTMTVIPRSPMASEAYAIAAGLSASIYWRDILSQLLIVDADVPVDILSDSQCAVRNAASTNAPTDKTLTSLLLLIHNLIERRDANLHWIERKFNCADVLTKANSDTTRHFLQCLKSNKISYSFHAQNKKIQREASTESLNLAIDLGLHFVGLVMEQ